MSHHVQDEKRALREVMRTRRRALTVEETRAAGARAALLLGRLLEHGPPVGLALCYAPLAGELDTAAIDGLLRQRGVRVAYPRLTNEVDGVGGIDLREARPEELVAGSRALRQPTEAAPRVSADALDLVVVPGLAFDARGGRLGFGGGFFDRLLDEAPGALRCGVCVGFEVVAEVPVEAHDRGVDVLVHERMVVTGARPAPARWAGALAAIAPGVRLDAVAERGHL